jgi:tetraacyldisaccharide 4'-kinase
LYWLGVTGKNFAYSKRWRQVHRLQRPVISVGSLSAGGAGKTPVVLMLADLLQKHGMGVDVLSRGYGRTSSTVEQVNPAGEATRFGDEPLEIAQAGIKVFVGAQRFEAGALAERTATAPTVHLLDDGFQHRQLARDLDLVLLTLDEVQDSLLPGGNLREPLSSLQRANIIILREDEAEQLRPIVTQHSNADVWTLKRQLILPPEIPTRMLAFCALARPQGFFAMLSGADCAVAGTVAFPDHHHYSEADVERLTSTARQIGATGFVTTAKDLVKISANARERLEKVGPVIVAGLRVTLADQAAAWKRINQLVRK